MTSAPGSWLHARPAERIEAGGIALQRAGAPDTDEVVEAVNESLEHLRPWMPWARQPATPQSIGDFLGKAGRDWDAGREFQFAVRGPRGDRAHAVIGFIGLHDRVGPGGLEIGYWVHVDCTRRGVATMAAAALTRSALGLGGVSRVEIHCDAANTRSAAIPAKLGFRLDRVVSRSAEAPGETGRLMIWGATSAIVAAPASTGAGA
jgi:RimJ/RimL family protein N-acetyltransferase